MNEVVLIAGMALVTFAVRYPPLALVSKIDLPERVVTALRYVPPVVLAAIIVPAVLMRGQSLYLAVDNTRLLATVLSALVMWRSKNLLLTIVLGMAVFLLLQAVIK